jgi:hypothetical protein
LGGTGDQNSVNSGFGSWVGNAGVCAIAAAGNKASKSVSFLIFPSRCHFPVAMLDLAA